MGAVAARRSHFFAGACVLIMVNANKNPSMVENVAVSVPKIMEFRREFLSQDFSKIQISHFPPSAKDSSQVLKSGKTTKIESKTNKMIEEIATTGSFFHDSNDCMV